MRGSQQQTFGQSVSAQAYCRNGHGWQQPKLMTDELQSNLILSWFRKQRDTFMIDEHLWPFLSAFNY
ncbi:uncharacterized protein PHALS_14894 [Plasmopara halstedii]|uniref:Uncharacterized protein n=1 Tax=Plasmopara halstedii TaxID=4781 RepID=A0A0N7L778_PLAHL|nr:uncharacterized protein PHALS_14894 [Plasmopara halstedii]CEG46315.1 hypothetical protein PHALS_14894 [Plasmopara halstedii]|eukprot:XP_024582684.1 hypothetical protein PHALS_14894 [Plasmopara halstedii]